MIQNNRSLFYALLAIIFWGTIATAIKIALADVNTSQLLAIATCISLITFFVLILKNKKLHLLVHQSKKQIFTSLLTGLINPFLYYNLLFISYSQLPAQEALILNYTWPILLLILSILFLKEKFTLRVMSATLICFLGVVVIISKGDILGISFTNLKGDLLVLSSAAIWAIYWIINLKDNRDPLIKLTSGFFFGAIFSLLYYFIFSNPTMPSTKGILASIYIGLFEMGITFFIWLSALNMAKKMSTIFNLAFITPFLSLCFISIFLKEPIKSTSIMGLSIIIIGIIVQNKKTKST